MAEKWQDTKKEAKKQKEMQLQLLNKFGLVKPGKTRIGNLSNNKMQAQ